MCGLAVPVPARLRHPGREAAELLFPQKNCPEPFLVPVLEEPFPEKTSTAE